MQSMTILRSLSRIFNKFFFCNNLHQVAKASTSSLAVEKLDQTQVSYLKEECILVDEDDNVIGSASKGNCHYKKTGALHRAFSVFLFDSDLRLILQKRSAFKITFPRVWTNSCCSHPLNVPEELETRNGIKNAAIRKLEHELNIKGLESDQLELAGRFLYKADSDLHWMEHELDYVLIVRNFNFPFYPNPEEVEDVRHVSRQELTKMLRDESIKFSPWFHLMYTSKQLEKWWTKLDANEAINYDETIRRLN